MVKTSPTTANHIKTSSVDIERLKIAMIASGVGFWELQLPDNIVSWDDNCRQLYGIARGNQLSYNDAIKYILPEDFEMVDTAVKAAMSGKNQGRYDARYRTLGADDGKLRWVRFTGQAFFDENGNPVHMNGIAQDITEIVNSSQKALEAQSLAQVALEASNAGSFRLQLETDELQYSPALSRIFTGRENGTLTRADLVNLIAPEDRASRKEAFRNAVKTGKLDYEARITWDDGSVHWVHIIGTYIREVAGGAPQVFTGTVLDITKDKKNREEAGIKASEERFRLLIEEAPLATCMFVGREMRIEIANNPMIAFWGKGKSVLGKPLAEAIPELREQPFLTILEDVFTTGKTYEAKSAYTRLVVDGVEGDYYFDFTYKPLRNADGELYAIMGMAIDVTQQVISRQKLEESERFATNIFHNSPVAKIVFVGEEMIIRTANENMLHMLGHDTSIIGKPFMKASPELVQTLILERYRKVLHTGETLYHYEEPLTILRQGQSIPGYYNYIYKALIDASKNIYGVMCTATDVTEQVLARQKVEEAEMSLRGAIELADLGTWSIDIKTYRISYSEKMIEWFGFNGKEESPEDGIRMLQEQDRVRIMKALAKALHPGSDGIFNEIYTVIHSGSGQKRIIHAQGKTVFNTAGELIKLNGTARDITIQQELQLALERQVRERTEELGASNEKLLSTNEELAHTNKELAQINNQLTRSNEELAQFAYVASHDLQEPLRKIRLFSGMLGEMEDSTDGGKTLINKIISSSDRMSLLIRDLLDFSRLLKTDKLVQSVDLNEVLKAVVNDFEITIEEKNAVVKVGVMPTLHAVSLQMNQLFYNLLGNALKFSRNEPAPVIEITADGISLTETLKYIPNPFSFAQYYRISISDNGIGFDTKYSDHIFEVFKRLHGRDIYPGSGIGLALCRRIIINHNGHLYAESTVGKGSIFHLILPDNQPNNDLK